VSVLVGVEHDLTRLPDDLRASGLAALARAMAERIDEGRGSPSECGKVLESVLVRLRELAPPKQEKDDIDELGAKRAARRAGLAGVAGAEAPPRS
jgi:hypothetical protein